ncbi:hypothetical protein PAXINDRAFT_109016 [Paxillus involutus ATCC 200175]|nr:hypothetical protein PAXINDRAFT_109016 [Paxillus involutus ATCC 200175]
MQNPERDLPHALDILTTAQSPAILHQAIEKFFVADASLRHPLGIVESGPRSRESILKVYDWYRAVSPGTKSKLNGMAYDKENGVIYLDVTQSFGSRFTPFAVVPSRLVVRIDLVENSGSFYIKTQETFCHPTDLANYLLPPIAPLVRFVLVMLGMFQCLGSSAYTHFCSLWITLFGMGSDVQRGKSRSTVEKGQKGNGSASDEEPKNAQYYGSGIFP